MKNTFNKNDCSPNKATFMCAIEDYIDSGGTVKGAINMLELLQTKLLREEVKQMDIKEISFE